jgi:MFS family permease
MATESTPLKPSTTVHPSAVQVFAIASVQLLNAADWAVILPIDTLIGDFVLGDGNKSLKNAFASLLVAAVYVPYPIALFIFRRMKGYKRIYGFWGFVTVLGNGLFAILLITNPPGNWGWLCIARLIQGFGQSISFANLQVLALTSSQDVRTMYKAIMNSCNQAGYAIGVAICGLVLQFTPATSTLGLRTPTYLVLGPLAIVACAGIVSVLFVLLHPDQIVEVAEEKRLLKGRAKTGATGDCCARMLSDTGSRKVRIIALAVLGFCRASVRASFLTVAVHVLVDSWQLGRPLSCFILAGMTLFSVALNMGLSFLQYKVPNFLSDDLGIVISEVINLLATIGMFSYGQPVSNAMACRWIVLGTIWMMGMALSATVVGGNITKYAIDEDPYFSTKALSTLQMLSQQCLGKALGPIIGMATYIHGGYDGYIYYQLSVAIVMIIVAHVFVIPFDVVSDCIPSCSCCRSRKAEDAEAAAPPLLDGFEKQEAGSDVAAANS